MKRREFITLLGGAGVAWPLRRVRSRPAKCDRIGLLSGGAPIGPLDERRKSLLSGLALHGFVEGRNVILEQRWADAHLDRLGALATELIEPQRLMSS